MPYLTRLFVLIVVTLFGLTLEIDYVRAQDENSSVLPVTADGQPNIQGVWTNFDPTPFEAPNDIDLERLAPLADWFPGTNRPQRPPETPDPNAGSVQDAAFVKIAIETRLINACDGT